MFSGETFKRAIGEGVELKYIVGVCGACNTQTTLRRRAMQRITIRDNLSRQKTHVSDNTEFDTIEDGI